MFEKAPDAKKTALSSEWMGLSKHLVASFYEVKKTGERSWGKTKDTDESVVYAPLTEASMELALNWQSPFESAGPEAKAPALMAMLQSGALQPIIDAIFGKTGNATADSAAQQSGEFLSQFQGKTGITKLNSTQVFNGMPPVKIQVTAIFRAWKDPVSEVETPFNKLIEWALPVSLSDDGSIVARVAQGARGEKTLVDTLFPSAAPTTIAMQYKGRVYAPLVIESISQPMASPIDALGRYVELVVPMTLCTLTAIDRKDWSSSAIKL